MTVGGGPSAVQTQTPSPAASAQTVITSQTISSPAHTFTTSGYHDISVKIGNTSASATMYVDPPLPLAPPKPTALNIAPSGTKTVLSWAESAGATYYKLFGKAAAKDAYTISKTPKFTTRFYVYDGTPLYRYAVQACNASDVCSELTESQP